ncbi:MAG: MBL fold metallo-hydrolase [Bacteroidota bacterium]
MNIQFLGAAGGEVTGSKHLITVNGLKILLDCGMYQGKGLETDHMNRDLGFDPMAIDYLILSHAHIDHSGLIPFITKLGFKGQVICTPATHDLCNIMLPDSGKIQEADTKNFNKRREKQKLPLVEPLYNLQDAKNCMGLFEEVKYNVVHQITKEISLKFTDSGHILGGAIVNLTIVENGVSKRLTYTGDIGRYEKRILRDPQPFPQTDYLILESTYGDRMHSPIEDADFELLRVVIDTCAKKKGKLIIPSFAIGRAQEIIYALDRLQKKKLLPDVDVFVDSPLAVSATDVFKRHDECFNEEILNFMKTDSDPFGFSKLHYVQSVEDSKHINSLNRPCIIISASGMVEAGRVKHHIANNIESSKTTILFVGYCAPSTLGARIKRGDSEVSIFGIKHPVNAEIRVIESYSGHADYSEMKRFLECQSLKEIKRTFLVHGESQTQAVFSEYLNHNGLKNIEIPNRGDVVEI